MKKFVKPLVIAASVAAIAGIGAVSFAQWTAGSSIEEKTGTGTSGTIATTAGALTVSPETAEKKLVPYDQSYGFVDSTMAKMHTYTVSYSGDASSTLYTFKMEIDNEDNLPLYYKLGTESVPTSTSGWTEYTEEVTLTDLASTGSVTINIIMVSTKSGAAATAEMGKSYTVKISGELA